MNSSPGPGQGRTVRLGVLVVDDEEAQRLALRLSLDEYHDVFEADDHASALRVVEADMVDVALVDFRLGHESGVHLVPRLLGAAPWLKVAMLSAHATIESAVDAMRVGALDYLKKPVDPHTVLALVERFAAARRLECRVEALEGDLRRSDPPPLLESRNSAMRRVFELAHKVAASDAAALIRGESGTGKGVLARFIHEASPRSEEVFAVINCPSLSSELLQSELFGHTKGAFTGAFKSQMGKVELAAGGTLLLDEVGDLPPAIQPKLLRFVQEQRYERVGDPRTREAEVRIISATNRNLEEAIEAGEFREDLLYRLKVIELTVPPLRDRPEDLEDLAAIFLRFFTQRHGRDIDSFSKGAWERIRPYAWPGNVRELQNAVERAVILCEAPTISAELLPASRGGDEHASRPSERQDGTGSGMSGRLASLEAVEAEHIRYVLEQTETLEEAKRILKIASSTLWRKRKKFDL